jgi:RNA polymerase sigma-70 factor, ECF subfamily
MKSMRSTYKLPHNLAEASALEMGRTGASKSQVGSDVLDVMLFDIIGAAQRTYPGIRVPTDIFAAHLGDRMPAEVPPLLALRQMHTADLYLACACTHGDVHAFAAFDSRCLRPLDRVLSRMGIDAELIAEVKQDIRSRVLIGDGKRAQIVEFSGRGDLRGWVRVMAVRRALQCQCRARREVPLDDDHLLEQLVGPRNSEFDHAKRVYRLEFKRAFEGALRDLPDRDLTLLRQHYVDALTVDELGSLYRVHRATAARLLVRARVLVLEATRARLMSQLHVQPDDLDSIIRMIRSQIEISLRGLLRRRKR